RAALEGLSLLLLGRAPVAPGLLLLEALLPLRAQVLLLLGVEVLRELVEIDDELVAHLLLLGGRGRGRQHREGNGLGEHGAAAEAAVVAQVARHLGRLLIALLRPLRERAVHDAVDAFRELRIDTAQWRIRLRADA